MIFDIFTLITLSIITLIFFYKKKKERRRRTKIYLSNDRFDVSTLLNTIDRDMEMETRLTLVFTIALQTTRLMELFIHVQTKIIPFQFRIAATVYSLYKQKKKIADEEGRKEGKKRNHSKKKDKKKISPEVYKVSKPHEMPKI